MNKELLIEIGVEELPAIPFLKELPNIRSKWQAVLDEYRLASEFEFYFTPRRLVLFHKNFALKQPDSVVQMIGAPKHVAIKDGAFSPAALSFAKKCGIAESELKFKEIDGKEVLYYEQEVIGNDSKNLLGDMVEKFLLSLSFGKSMRWGRGEFEFIRPIRSFLCLLGDESVSFTKFGIASEARSYPHRDIGYEKVGVASISEYFSGAKARGIVLDANERRVKILEQFKAIEAQNGVEIGLDEDLLDEVVAITEAPNALLGGFEAEFLEVPSEVIITSMKENQRYFPVFKNGKLSNHFVVVSNSLSTDSALIVQGNEKVLRARLSDAMFFWQSDLKAEFSPEKLKNVTYLKELGNTYEKCERELKVALALSEKFADKLRSEVGSEYKELLTRAVMLSKADLTSGMVYEFTELQGVMGSYYARAKGESEAVVRAIGEQYLPNGEASAMPSTTFSALVALAIKLETLVGLFSVGKIPTGNKDPYALRRAANGVIKILQDNEFSFDMSEFLSDIAKGYTKFDVGALVGFINERLYTFFESNPSIIKACLSSAKGDLLAQISAIKALEKVCASESFRENFSTFKRLANIIKDEIKTGVDESLFEAEAERNLYAKFKEVAERELGDEDKLNTLFALKGAIDGFFDAVMINAEDAKIRHNRQALVGEIYSEFLKIADIKEISL
ncbi:Glycine--tRNA ligase beta subunit [Campylobacter suis]|uniref:Glycine--tRNA ligase beta subunit n=2 Tax=Campylobacter suis TaxID=2790657 RepID=A0ABM8Q1M0_9BACT|nr:Glycine--tRNA ligase beta subunit [Campylobacter suis]